MDESNRLAIILGEDRVSLRRLQPSHRVHLVRKLIRRTKPQLQYFYDVRRLSELMKLERNFDGNYPDNGMGYGGYYGQLVTCERNEDENRGDLGFKTIFVAVTGRLVLWTYQYEITGGRSLAKVCVLENLDDDELFATLLTPDRTAAILLKFESALDTHVQRTAKHAAAALAAHVDVSQILRQTDAKLNYDL